MEFFMRYFANGSSSVDEIIIVRVYQMKPLSFVRL